MWEEYKRRFWVSHLIMLIAVIVTWQVAKFEPKQIVLIVIAMEVGSVMGAAMGAKIKRDVKKSDDDLPLSKP